MGTMISLGIGKLEIDWGKNDVFENFRDLFQPQDWKDIKATPRNSIRINDKI